MSATHLMKTSEMSSRGGDGSEGDDKSINQQTRPYGSLDNTDGAVGESPSEPEVAQNATAQLGSYARRNTVDGLLVISTLDLLEAEMEKERLINLLAASHFSALYDWFLFLPSVLLTLVGGILAFVSNDSGLDLSESTSSLFSTAVGIISLISVFWQSLSKQLNLGGRGMMHQSAAVALKRLVDKIPFVKLDPNFSVEETDAFIAQMNEKFTQALDSCTSSPPLRITAAFYSARSHIDRHLEVHNNDLCKEFNMKREDLYNAGSAELFAIFTNTFLFPFRLPSSTYAAETAMENLHKLFQEARHAPAQV